MDTVDKIFYKDSKKKFKKYSDLQLIMYVLYDILGDMDDLKPIYRQNSGSTQALQEELIDRIDKDTK